MDSLTDEALGALIRRKLVSGVLPHSRSKIVWAGYGANRPCNACDRVISTHETEWEVDIPGVPTCHFHWRCLGAWDDEVARGREMSGGAPIADTWIFDHGAPPGPLAVDALLLAGAEARHRGQWLRRRSSHLRRQAAAVRDRAAVIFASALATAAVGAARHSAS